jgi:hypothetical protein
MLGPGAGNPVAYLEGGDPLANGDYGSAGAVSPGTGKADSRASCGIDIGVTDQIGSLRARTNGGDCDLYQYLVSPYLGDLMIQDLGHTGGSKNNAWIFHLSPSFRFWGK